jgi:hypothetical protein
LWPGRLGQRRPPLSSNLKRHGDSQEVISWWLLLMASLFWAMARLTDRPIMEPDDYGHWVTQFPAEYWAWSLMVASTVFLLGVIINGNWRWSPLLRLIGAGWHLITLVTFSAGAWWETGGNFITIAAGSLAAVHLVFVWWNTCDLAAGVRRGKE